MKIISAIESGLLRTVRAWKGILIYWLVSFLMVTLLVNPLKAGFQSVLGKSMITEKLSEGLNVDALGDMGPALHSLSASLFSGFVILVLTAILANVFLSGGLFDQVKGEAQGAGKRSFFSAGAANFWSFLIITCMFILMIAVSVILVIGMPVGFAANAESAPEGTTMTVIKITCIVFVILLSVFLLAADYARAWQVLQPEHRGFKAIGSGFGMTFKNFFSSLPLMLIMIFLQFLAGFLLYSIIARFIPAGGGGLFMLFLVSQAAVLINIFIRVLRYASVTTLMEINANENKIVEMITEIENKSEL
jgi:hypothetical protein